MLSNWETKTSHFQNIGCFHGFSIHPSNVCSLFIRSTLNQTGLSWSSPLVTDHQIHDAITLEGSAAIAVLYARKPNQPCLRGSWWSQLGMMYFSLSRVELKKPRISRHHQLDGPEVMFYNILNFAPSFLGSLKLVAPQNKPLGWLWISQYHPISIPVPSRFLDASDLIRSKASMRYFLQCL